MSDCKVNSNTAAAATAEKYLANAEHTLKVTRLNKIAYNDLVEDVSSLNNALASDDVVGFAEGMIDRIETTLEISRFASKEARDVYVEDLAMWMDIRCAGERSDGGGP
jgi:hypothetical protein